MPSPGAPQGGRDAWLRSLQKQIDRLSRRPPGLTAVLFVSDLADGPPTDGSVFWYVTDEWC